MSSEGQGFGSRPPSPALYTCDSTGAWSPSEADSLNNRNISPGEFQLMKCLVGEIHLLHNWNANRSDCRLICSNLANLRTAPSGWNLGWLRGSASHGKRGGRARAARGDGWVPGGTLLALHGPKLPASTVEGDAFRTQTQDCGCQGLSDGPSLTTAKTQGSLLAWLSVWAPTDASHSQHAGTHTHTPLL